MSKTSTSNYYRLLQISPTATTKEIKAKFRKLAFKLHPDTNGNCPQTTKKFQQLAQAHDILSDASARKKYDRENGFHRTTTGSNYNSHNEFYRNVKMNKRGEEWGKVYAPRPPPGFQTFDHELWYEMHYNGGDLKEALNRSRERRQLDTESHTNGNGFSFQRRDIILSSAQTSSSAAHKQRVQARDDVVARMDMRRAQRKRRAREADEAVCVIS